LQLSSNIALCLHVTVVAQKLDLTAQHSFAFEILI